MVFSSISPTSGDISGFVVLLSPVWHSSLFPPLQVNNSGFVVLLSPVWYSPLFPPLQVISQVLFSVEEI